MDAGWFVQNDGWPQVGTWEVDAESVSARIETHHAITPIRNGLKILLWFEPERVATGTWLAENHPEWILGGTKGEIFRKAIRTNCRAEYSIWAIPRRENG